jgi:D-glycero-D-manno-heptose 1,7-bisphosphate phosphatase
MLDLKSINKDWTIFLDRDGVINHEKYMDYVYNYDEFIFYEDVPWAIRILSEIAGRVIITTNQRGVGKGLMTEETLVDIHNKMLRDLKAAGGRIDAIYYCTAVNNDHPNRKPNPGMIHTAQADFRGIDLRKSLIVGNNLSDMEFGRNGGIHTVFVKTTHPEQALPHPLIDKAFDSLPDFAKALQLR